MKSLLLILPLISLLKGTAPTSKKSSPIDGAWKLVWATSNGKQVDVVKNPQIKFFADGCFSLLASTGDGKIDYAGYGTFELNGSSYNEVFQYHNVPEYVGAKDWQEIELRGDTLYAIGFKKVMIQDKVVKDFPMIEEKRVRMP